MNGRSRFALVGVLVAFTVSLVVWAGHAPSTGAAITVSPAAAIPTSPLLPDNDLGAGSTASATGPAAATSGAPATAGTVHTITFSASSDEPILAVSYDVRGGRPVKVYRTRVASPLRVTVRSTATGLLGGIGVQAASGARSIACSMAVDGVVVSRHAARGGFAVAVCQA